MVRVDPGSVATSRDHEDRRSAAAVGAIDWAAVWDALAVSLDVHVGAGRRHLLTEDVVRFATVAVLADHHVVAERLVAERTVDGIGRVDLIVDAPHGAAVEFKFPREPAQTNAADTMAFGELLRDFYRLGRLEVADRWAVQLLRPSFRRYLARRSELAWTDERGTRLVLPAGLRDSLPVSAKRCLPEWALDEVHAECVTARRLGDDRLVVYRVERSGPGDQL